jgi:hypothetical protein
MSRRKSRKTRRSSMSGPTAGASRQARAAEPEAAEPGAARPQAEDVAPTEARESRGGVGAARQRVALAVALVALLLVVGGVVVLGSSGDGQTIAAAPSECIEAWNADETALGTGAHAASLHGYTRAWAVYMGEAGEPNPDSDGSCAIVFPAVRPDPEPPFAAIILVGDRWVPLSEQPGVSPQVLSELQNEALDSANANLFPNGSLAPR